MQQKESAARQALRKKRARKRTIRLAGAAALALIPTTMMVFTAGSMAAMVCRWQATPKSASEILAS